MNYVSANPVPPVGHYCLAQLCDYYVKQQGILEEEFIFGPKEYEKTLKRDFCPWLVFSTFFSTDVLHLNLYGSETPDLNLKQNRQMSAPAHYHSSNKTRQLLTKTKVSFAILCAVRAVIRRYVVRLLRIGPAGLYPLSSRKLWTEMRIHAMS